MFQRQPKQNQDSTTFTNKYYMQFSYPESHWACHVPTQNDENFIAILKIFDIQIALKLNSTDARGYRAIVGLVNENDITSTFNRDYSDTEKLALKIPLFVS